MANGEIKFLFLTRQLVLYKKCLLFCLSRLFASPLIDIEETVGFRRFRKKMSMFALRWVISADKGKSLIQRERDRDARLTTLLMRCLQRLSRLFSWVHRGTFPLLCTYTISPCDQKAYETLTTSYLLEKERNARQTQKSILPPFFLVKSTC